MPEEELAIKDRPFAQRFLTAVGLAFAAVQGVLCAIALVDHEVGALLDGERAVWALALTFALWKPRSLWITAMLVFVRTQVSAPPIDAWVLATIPFLAIYLFGLRRCWPLVMLSVAALVGMAWNQDLSLTRVSRLFYFLAMGIASGVLLRLHDAARIASRARLDEARKQTLALPREVRSSIARELHDVVAYNLSVISLLHNAASESRDEAELRSAISRTRLAAATVVSELEGLTAPLLTNQFAATDASPCALFRQLTTDLESHGFRVEDRLSSELENLAPGLRQTTCRILQECVTNILRHGAPADVCSFEASKAAESLHLRISNGIGGGYRPLRSQSLGVGLRGLRERLQLLGGSFSAKREGNVWVVQAVLPTNAGVPGALVSAR